LEFVGLLIELIHGLKKWERKMDGASIAFERIFSKMRQGSSEEDPNGFRSLTTSLARLM
jgi:hypothetical protein